MRRRPFSAACVAAFACGLAGCPAPAGQPLGGAVAAPASSAAPLATPSEAARGGDEGAEGIAPLYVPGEPFPVPQPLPAKSIGRLIQGGPAPQSGAGPIEFWIGGKGKEDGRFAYPRALVTNAEGVLFVADKTGRIQKFSPEGSLLALVRTPGVVQGKPTGLGIDPEGNLLVADTHYCRVLRYDAADLTLESWYGAPGRDPGRFMMITAVQATRDGKLHFTTDFGDDVARVQVFRPDGTYVRSWGTFGDGPLQFKRPMNLALDEDRDRVYVADSANHRVGVFDLEGKFIAHFGGQGREAGQLQYPYDVKVGESGEVWVAEFGNQRISVFDPEGALLGSWGAPRRALGGLNRPWAVALGPKGRVWALDSNGDRCYALRQNAFLGGSK
ncbi:MAG: SMP-30/gluconolactonase/LRE family protein [Planctomycetes bacterium]|nr:SMP-30/gluconolactonase/LRE family protein [Planctomycetota bacterium]